ncbi:MAG TPA: hypothetical protein P5277_01155 [Candidatus Paceibacterota bacterium]|nr:hypothetical protein [Candidatus Paceibacterota bacterium]
MKKKLVIVVINLLFIINFANAICDINATLINQDPYPAIPGEYVKLLFQISGVENSLCKGAKFELLEEYPLIFDPNIQNKFEINSSTYTYDYNSYLMVPYKVRIDKEAINGNNPITTILTSNNNQISILNKFNLEIKDVKTNFEVYIKNYNSETSIITFEVLNIGKNNVEAVTIEIPQQDSISVKGSRSNIIGDLDINEYSTGDFEVIPNSNKFNIKIKYNDAIQIRREQTYEVTYEKELFESRKNDKKSTPWTMYFAILILLIIVIGLYLKRKIKIKRKLFKS